MSQLTKLEMVPQNLLQACHAVFDLNRSRTWGAVTEGQTLETNK
jgi:hypothetical protein